MRSVQLRLLVFGAASATSLVSTACAVPMRAGGHAQPGHDLAEYVSFVWDEPQERPTGDPRLDGNPLFQQRVHAAIDWELSIRGIEPFSTGPDPELGRSAMALAVHHHTSLQDHEAVYPADLGPGVVPDDAEARVIRYQEATFIVGLVDAQTRELVWSAWATLDFDKALASPAMMQAQVDAAVAAMFESFPVPVGRSLPQRR